MADNFLEYHYEEYERRKAIWLAKSKKRNTKSVSKKNNGTLFANHIARPEDEAL